MPERNAPAGRVSTGIKGLDYILHGGLPENRTYVVHGGPGAGKSTLALQFLMAGARIGQRCLYVTLLQSRAELEDVVRGHRWSLEGVEILELPEDVRRASEAGQTVFSTAEVELHEVADAIGQAIEQHRPQRMVLDSISELAILVENTYQLRRQLLKLKRQLSAIHCTSLICAGAGPSQQNVPIQTMVHGVIGLEMQAPVYGRDRRRLQVSKLRGSDYVGGYHDFRIRTGGLEVYPRLQFEGRVRKADWSVVASGNAGLDTLLGGGLEQGSTCLLTGTTGSGKSTLASLYVEAGARRGDRAAVFCFDEGKATFLRRSAGLGIQISRYVDSGLVDLRQIDVGEISPGEFVQDVRHAAEREDIRIVVIDSLTGYIQAMPGERELMIQLHELLTYLNSAGVLTLMVVATHGLFGDNGAAVDASYIADTVVLLRHFEAMGSVRRCISVLKKRHGRHERTIREVQFSSDGIRVGQPLSEFSGTLTGLPRFEGRHEKLFNGTTGNDAGQTHAD